MFSKGFAYLPSYKIEVNGTNQTGLVRKRLIDINVSFSAGGESDSLDITLDDSDTGKRLSVPLSNSDTVKIWLGYENNLQEMGTYIVNSVNLKGGAGSADTFSINAKAIDTSKHMFDKKYYTWVAEEKGKKIKLGNIISKIAKDNSLDLAIETALENFETEREIQRRESDISFLRFLAEKYSAIVKFYDKKLVFLSKDSKSVTGVPIPPKFLFPADIKDWNVKFGNRWSFKTFIGEWWDKENAAMKQEKVTNSDAENDKEYIIDRVYNSAEEAKKAANTEMQKSKSESNKLTLNIIGDPEIRPFTPIIIAGVRTNVDGKWRANRVTHSLSNSGYTTSLPEMSEM